jgi:hypothetical protein
MDYPVRVSYRPLTRETRTDVVYIIIQPQSPRITEQIAKDMLEWVENGGRLIFLCNSFPFGIFDELLEMRGNHSGSLRVYRHGRGELITGRAREITNAELMENHATGEMIQTTLSRWNSERRVENIFFAEYYHGIHIPETMVARLPLVIRLILAQIVILAIILVWHLGKRFGNAIPYYEEVEREENEYVRALARLYMAAKANSFAKNRRR